MQLSRPGRTTWFIFTRPSYFLLPHLVCVLHKAFNWIERREKNCIIKHERSVVKRRRMGQVIAGSGWLVPMNDLESWRPRPDHFILKIFFQFFYGQRKFPQGSCSRVAASLKTHFVGFNERRRPNVLHRLIVFFLLSEPQIANGHRFVAH